MSNIFFFFFFFLVLFGGDPGRISLQCAVSEGGGGKAKCRRLAFFPIFFRVFAMFFLQFLFPQKGSLPLNKVRGHPRVSMQVDVSCCAYCTHANFQKRQEHLHINNYLYTYSFITTNTSTATWSPTGLALCAGPPAPEVGPS